MRLADTGAGLFEVEGTCTAVFDDASLRVYVLVHPADPPAAGRGSGWVADNWTHAWVILPPICTGNLAQDGGPAGTAVTPAAGKGKKRFPTPAFGSFLWPILIGQFAAKVAGSFVRPLVFRWLDGRALQPARQS